MAAKYWLTGVGTLLLLAALLLGASNTPLLTTATLDNSPGQGGGGVTKLVFIHHSVGGHWLAHDYGGLVSELNRNGFYVNDIAYGWQPAQSATWTGRLLGLFGASPTGASQIGDRTDIGNFPDWFIGPDASMIMAAVYRENSETAAFGEHGNAVSAAPLANPGLEIENTVVMIKPCYPNSLYRGGGADEPNAIADPPRNFTAGSEQHTVANSKRIYNDILNYFASRPDKFFVLVTAPPRVELPDNGRVARAFSNWLVHDWLQENEYPGNNVMVFDLFNVLTSGENWQNNDLGASTGNHHRLLDGVAQHQVRDDGNVLIYPRDGNNNHPSPAGLQKATGEFVELFRFNYGRWADDGNGRVTQAEP